MIERGKIYLARLGKKHGSEKGKTRPVLVVQTNVLNRNLDRMAYKGVVVMPLTTNLMGGDLRVRIPARDDLQKESEVCVNEIYTIDVSRFVIINEVLTTLSEEEMEEVERKLAFVLGMLNYVDILFG